MPHVMWRWREVLEDTAPDFRGDRRLSKAGDRKDPEGKHRGRPRAADIPAEMTALDRAARAEVKLLRPDVHAPCLCVAELGARAHRYDMLGPEAWLGAPSASVNEV